MREQTIGPPLDSRARTTTITRFNFKSFFAYSQIIDTPDSFIVHLFHQNKKSAVIVIEGG